MKWCLITFRSVTPAQRAEKLLMDKRVQCTLQRTPRWMQEQGCGYSLRLAAGSVVQAVALMEQGKLAYRKVYCAGAQGKWEEMEL